MHILERAARADYLLIPSTECSVGLTCFRVRHAECECQRLVEGTCPVANELERAGNGND